MSHYAWPPPGLVRSCSDARTIAAILLNGKSRLSASLTRGRSSSHIFPPPLPASAHSPSRPVYCLRCVSPNVPPDGGSHDSQQERDTDGTSSPDEHQSCCADTTFPAVPRITPISTLCVQYLRPPAIELLSAPTWLHSHHDVLHRQPRSSSPSASHATLDQSETIRLIASGSQDAAGADGPAHPAH